MVQHIAKVGFELEGGWKGAIGVSPFKDISLVADGSINGQALGENDHAICPTHVGEAISPPIPIEEKTPEGKLVWSEWLRTHWPDADPPDRTNSTCGYHIHVSLSSMKDYTLLSSKVFLFNLKDALCEVAKTLDVDPEDGGLRDPIWNHFWQRMGGRNRFCLLTFDPAQQMKIKKDGGIHNARYGWLNFSWAAHGTLEFRALPTFHSVEVALRLTEAYFDFLNSWLDANDVEIVREVKF